MAPRKLASRRPSVSLGAPVATFLDVRDVILLPSLQKTKNGGGLFKQYPTVIHPENEVGSEPPPKRRRISNDAATNDAIPSSDQIGSDDLTLAKIRVRGSVTEQDLSCVQDLNSLPDENAVKVRKVSWASDHRSLLVQIAYDARKKTCVAELKLSGPSVDSQLFKHLDWASFIGRSQSKSIIATYDCTLRFLRDIHFAVELALTITWPAGPSSIAHKIKTSEPLLHAYFPPTARIGTKWTPKDFYHSVHVPDRHLKVSEAIQTGDLATQLYPFQGRAVNWLLWREGVQFDDGCKLQLVKRSAKNLSYISTEDAESQSCHVSHLLCHVNLRMEDHEDFIAGGILAEEMGLGKTVEIIALILLNKCRTPRNEIIDTYTGVSVTTSGATLIISPPAILEQWKSELEIHAPSLIVMHYEGVKHSKLSDDGLKELLLHQDVVLTTYGVLANEIHYADSKPERNLRHEKKYTPRRTPLVQISWWRVCLDEAQMVESGVSNAARVARLIPRMNAWAVSGTPLRKDVNDLLGLLVFLRYEPFCNTEIWKRLIIDYKDVFKDLFGSIAMRHSKSQVRDELHIPPQRRIVISVPFTAVEEQNYLHIFQQMCDECGLDRDGSPLHGDWDPTAASTIAKMRYWLTRLRQTCLHAEIGVRNRRALGRANGPLRTVEEVLEVLIEQNETSLRGEERGVLLAKATIAHVLSFGKDRQGALDLYLEGLQESTTVVQECREQLENEQNKFNKARAERIKRQKDDDDTMSESEEEAGNENATRLNVHKQRLRVALEMQHVFTFFSATAYYQLKESLAAAISSTSSDTANKDRQDDSVASAITRSDQSHSMLDTPAGKNQVIEELEKKESASYEHAKAIRKELLAEVSQKTNSLIRKVSMVKKDSLINMPMMVFMDNMGGIESRKILDKIDDLSEFLNTQGKQLQKWRSKYIELLTARLLDQDEDMEMTGEEYELSTKQQDEQYACHEVLRAAHADRHCMITGQLNQLVNHEMAQALKLATDGMRDEPEQKGPAPELMRSMLSARAAFNQKLNDLSRQSNLPTDTPLSLRGLIAEMRSVITTLQWQEGGRSNRATAEAAILEEELKRLQQVTTEQMKALQAFEKELDLFRSTMNQRLEFYRQLQQISDTVAPLQEKESEQVDQQRLAKEKENERRHGEKLAVFKTKRRFLNHLRSESSGNSEQRICVICQSNFENGVLTVCGHQYCKDCISLWWRSHGTCPTCKRHLTLRDFHDITYKPQAIQAQEETHDTQNETSTPNTTADKANSTSLNKPSIYNAVATSTLAEIKSIDLRTIASYGTKIDTLARHLFWLRAHDPGCKSIIFSQFGDFLATLGSAFNNFKIGYSSIDAKGGIARFREDPAVECFLLHAKANSSGLNLINATHVFLCEPLINPAIELQAIARVHRIGQRRNTTVWMYLVKDTVEESIYDISVSRRLAHMQRSNSSSNKKGKDKAKSLSATTTSISTSTSRATTPGAPGLEERNLEAANSLELQTAPISALLTQGHSGGEVVDTDDLWQCLFGKAANNQRGISAGVAAGSGSGSGSGSGGTVEQLLATNGEGAGAREMGRFLRAEAAEGRSGTASSRVVDRLAQR